MIGFVVFADQERNDPRNHETHFVYFVDRSFSKKQKSAR